MSAKTKFTITAKPTFPGTVEIHAANGDVMELSVVFKHHPVDQIDELVRRAGETRHAPEQAAFLLEEILVGWEGVIDEKKRPVKLTLETLTAAILNHPDTSPAIFTTWALGLRGARLGN